MKNSTFDAIPYYSIRCYLTMKLLMVILMICIWLMTWQTCYPHCQNRIHPDHVQCCDLWCFNFTCCNPDEFNASIVIFLAEWFVIFSFLHNPFIQSYFWFNVKVHLLCRFPSVEFHTKHLLKGCQLERYKVPIFLSSGRRLLF